MSMMEAVPPAAVAVAALDAVPVAAADLVMATAVPAAAVRRAALDRWQAAHDPAHLQDPARLAEAAAFAPLLDSEQEPAFDAVLFAELIEFLAEMPW